MPRLKRFQEPLPRRPRRGRLNAIRILMSWPVLIAAFLSALKFIAHTFFGTRQTWSTHPPAQAGRALHRNWHQAVAAWHLVTADLLLMSVLQFVLAFHPEWPFFEEAAILISAFYGLWTLLWLINFGITRGAHRFFWGLPQWMFFLANSVLMLWGAYGASTF